MSRLLPDCLRSLHYCWIVWLSTTDTVSNRTLGSLCLSLQYLPVLHTRTRSMTTSDTSLRWLLTASFRLSPSYSPRKYSVISCPPVHVACATNSPAAQVSPCVRAERAVLGSRSPFGSFPPPPNFKPQTHASTFNFLWCFASYCWTAAVVKGSPAGILILCMEEHMKFSLLRQPASFYLRVLLKPVIPGHSIASNLPILALDL